MTNNKITAHWHIDLQTQCPHCEESFNLTDYISMCEIPIEIGQASKDPYTIECPECKKEFTIDEVYGW